MNKKIGLVLLIAGIVIGVHAFNNQKKGEQVVIPRNELQENIKYTENLGLNPGEYTVNSTTSILNWEGATPVKKHYGTVDVQSGSLTVGDDIISGIIVFDMTSIASEVGESLDSHLKDLDFFDTDNHPQSILNISGYINGEIQGDLTIKGITQPVSLPAEITTTESDMNISAEFSLDRTLWEVNYNSASVFGDLGDTFINDSIDFRVNIVADKK